MRPSATGNAASQDSSKKRGIVAFINVPANTLAAYNETVIINIQSIP